MDQLALAGKGSPARVALRHLGHWLTLLLVVLVAGCASSGGGTGSGGGWYVVQRGDTLHGIANRAGVPLLRVQRFNPTVSPERLEVGQRLRLPDGEERAPGSGSYQYRVRAGDTYTALANLFSTSVGAIQQANPGVSANQLPVGRLISIPRTAGSGGVDINRQRAIAASRAAPAAPLPRGVGNWPWPLRDAQVSREFGADGRGSLQPMLLTAGSDLDAKAVYPGTVRFAEEMRQLGRVVIIHHANDLQTVYAQCASLEVSVGAQVAPGTPVCRLARDPSTQRAELLFDVRNAGKPVDPRRLLR
ncbi:M23 family metallopeptidase [Halotalea alkalilenta]|uniref:M23 family metallopeptidase n=1 Tax=Halotalea alkalilenta TaxID=376489 RepID=UPI0009DE7D04|nr:M23 family metallopeptidase [Halotalea alkalilenta]